MPPRFGPATQGGPGPSPPPRRAPPGRTRDRSPLPACSRRTASSPFASRGTVRRSTRTRGAGGAALQEAERRGRCAAMGIGDTARNDAMAAGPAAGGSWRRTRPRGRSPAAASPSPRPRGAAPRGAPSPRGRAPRGW